MAMTGFTVRCLPRTWLSIVPLAAFAATSHAQTEGDLAKQLANPISSLISVPFQSNFELDVGDDDGFRYTLNTQPVIPFEIAEHWNLISRTILPTVYQACCPAWATSSASAIPCRACGSRRGSRARGAGYGASDPFCCCRPQPRTGSARTKWGAGPTAVVLKQQGPGADPLRAKSRHLADREVQRRFGGGLKVYVDAPDGLPDWGIRAFITLLYPR